MKKFKSGFTLAEVLITLGIIGVIAAIVMPTVMTNHTYKTVGVKLQKFMSQVEGSARPYVVSNENFETKAHVSDYILNSFLLQGNDSYTEIVDCTGNTQENGVWSMADQCGSSTDKNHEYIDLVYDTEPGTLAANATGERKIDDQRHAILKDGTGFVAYMLSDYDESNIDELNPHQVGEVVFGFAFAPNVNGLPKSAQKSYRYVVTELGYVYPDRTDECMNDLANANFAAKSTHYADGASCAVDD